jgi:hypothetical protein
MTHPISSEPPLKVSVDGVGEFTFRHRTQRDSFRILGNAERMTGGPVAGAGLWRAAMMFATLEALALEAPDGWDFSALDPFVDEDVVRAEAAFRGLEQAEATFRARPGAKRARAGAGAS